MTTATLAARDATWSERGSTSAVFLALGLSIGAWAAVLPALKSTLSLSDRALSLALLAVAIGSVIATQFAGALAPRLGTGRATTGAAVALAVAMALLALAGNLAELVGFALVFGLAGGFLDVSMNGHASEIERRWGRAIMSSFHGAFSLGGLLGATLGGLIAAAGLGPVGQLTIPAALIGCLAVGARFGLGPGSRSEARGSGLAWPERAAWGLCAVALLCLIVEGAMSDWSAVYLATIVRVSDAAAASGYAAFSITMTIGRLVGDHIVRRLGPQRVVVGGGILSATGLALSVGLPAFVPATIGFAMVGFGLANVAPTIFSAAGRFGRTPAAGIAMVVSLGYVGFISGPPLIGAIASLSNLRVALGFLAGCSVAMVAAAFWMRVVPPR